MSFEETIRALKSENTKLRDLNNDKIKEINAKKDTLREAENSIVFF